MLLSELCRHLIPEHTHIWGHAALPSRLRGRLTRPATSAEFPGASWPGPRTVRSWTCYPGTAYSGYSKGEQKTAPLPRPQLLLRQLGILLDCALLICSFVLRNSKSGSPSSIRVYPVNEQGLRARTASAP